jgi:broad specificity phosphatase PhoE
MSYLCEVSGLANRYRVMRHGQSKANVAGIIVSSAERDRGGDYGLTVEGQRQALAAASGSGLPPDTLICSSDFARAAETARIVADCLGAAAPVTVAALRERSFGDLDGGPVSEYARVWASDASGAAPAGGAEPAAAVLGRVTAFIAGLEGRHRGRDILLVSHGDTLQILQAGLARADPATHRSLPHLETAEIRLLRLAPPAGQAGPAQAGGPEGPGPIK